MFELVVCAIVKNEARYLQEWIAFHVAAGVEHFILYSNESSDGTWKLLHKHPAITCVPWPGSSQQLVAYDHCLYLLKEKARWVAFIDVDEFLFNPEARDLRDILCFYSHAPSVVVHWVVYGSSGKELYSPAPVITRFRWRAKGVNPHVKSIIQPRRTLRVGRDPHRFICDAPAVDENNLLVSESPLLENGTANILRINHYMLKSKQEYQQRCAIARADNGEFRDFEKNFKAHDKNEAEDISAHVHLPAIADLYTIDKQWEA